MFDLDQFEERAAIMEYQGGLTRFAAETAAAAAQGKSRWEVKNEIAKRNIGHARNNREANDGKPKDDLSELQSTQAQKNRSLFERGV